MPMTFAAITGEEVANLSRNVIVESAEPARSRGHTMYHRGSAGSISYAEFRHLGKEGVLGKYALHFHQVGDSMRARRGRRLDLGQWKSLDHDSWNQLPRRSRLRRLSVGRPRILSRGWKRDVQRARSEPGRPGFCRQALPGRLLQFDGNLGAGFWWANSLNSFTRNLAVECDRYGFRYEATQSESSPLVRPVLTAEGQRVTVDIRTLPFLRFQGNELHSEPYGVNMGEGVAGVGPDAAHPFLLRETKVWDAYWAFQPSAALGGGRWDGYLQLALWNLPAGLRPAGSAVRQGDIQGRALSGFLAAGPTALPGEQAAVPVGIDDRPPITVITQITTDRDGYRHVRGTTADNGEVKRVCVNGSLARPTAPNFLEWEAVVEGSHPASTIVSAFAEDVAGNVEPRPHIIDVR